MKNGFKNSNENLTQFMSFLPFAGFSGIDKCGTQNENSSRKKTSRDSGRRHLADRRIPPKNFINVFECRLNDGDKLADYHHR
jgi:hypothetical protein